MTTKIQQMLKSQCLNGVAATISHKQQAKTVGPKNIAMLSGQCCRVPSSGILSHQHPQIPQSFDHFKLF